MTHKLLTCAALSLLTITLPAQLRAEAAGEPQNAPAVAAAPSGETAAKDEATSSDISTGAHSAPGDLGDMDGMDPASEERIDD
jgi:hypothetical protein